MIIIIVYSNLFWLSKGKWRLLIRSTWSPANAQDPSSCELMYTSVTRYLVNRVLTQYFAQWLYMRFQSNYNSMFNRSYLRLIKTIHQIPDYVHWTRWCPCLGYSAVNKLCPISNSQFQYSRLSWMERGTLYIVYFNG